MGKRKLNINSCHINLQSWSFNLCKRFWQQKIILNFPFTIAWSATHLIHCRVGQWILFFFFFFVGKICIKMLCKNKGTDICRYRKRGTQEPGRQCFSMSHTIEHSLSKVSEVYDNNTNECRIVCTRGRRKHIDSKTYVLW